MTVKEMEQAIKELKREQRMRKKVYPSRIRQRIMTRDLANYRWALMQKMIAHFEQEINDRLGEQKTLL